ncbi:Nuclear fragile X mental retardation-interacting protein 1 (NUFIP1) [Rhizoctonia solani]|uniref:Nuclear fragile X mental retardation-interacting protein 1 (NUFIP1) n=1 Tax=Rhizoctonia solani TaxID=456999 RepID=A0A8H7IKF5_9AGAM|nr:Nuclear fragile X mental retardation-interacting protein 1 (NUFIP1) [Rhizoctonia solani]
MSWNGSFGLPPPYSYTNGQQSGYHQTQMQPHYAGAYHYRQQGVAVPQSQITIPSPGVFRNQSMASLVPLHMRNRGGPVKCGHEGCLFTGTQKEVEVHKMDRHLIFPPGWQERSKGKRKREEGDNDYVDEEAQFRASGSASILGTNVKLDSPEAIAAWLEERKRRWPSAKRVAEKVTLLHIAHVDPSPLIGIIQVQHRREALERGQILTEPSRPHQLRADSSHGQGGAVVVAVESPALEDEGGRGRPLANEPRPVNADESKRITSATSDTDTSTSTLSSSESDESASDDGSESDMDPVKDAVSSKVELPADTGTEAQSSEANETTAMRICEEAPPKKDPSKQQMLRKNAAQPPKPAYNPFNQRPNLLRNLLMPDIQATVSNLSQAIKFLVANDFLKNVELKPGDAENIPIQPMDIDTQPQQNDTQV